MSMLDSWMVDDSAAIRAKPLPFRCGVVVLGMPKGTEMDEIVQLFNDINIVNDERGIEITSLFNKTIRVFMHVATKKDQVAAVTRDGTTFKSGPIFGKICCF